MHFMEQHVDQMPVPDLEKPLLIFKIGILGCVPLDMSMKLAEKYGAMYISSETARHSLIDKYKAAGVTYQPSKLNNDRIISREVKELAKPALYDRADVVLDKFYITPNTRANPIELARRTGALTVALSIITPFDIIYNRVERWVNEDSFDTPLSEWQEHPMARMRNMKRKLQRPERCLPETDYVFNIDGSTDTEGILYQFDDKLEFFGLERDPEQYTSIKIISNSK